MAHTSSPFPSLPKVLLLTHNYIFLAHLKKEKKIALVMEKFLLKNQCIINQIKFVVSIAVLTVTFLSTSIQLASAIEGNETDRLALLTLKQHLVGANSPGPLLSWNASLHFCYWYGIRCDRNRQRVIGLQLGTLKVAAAGTIIPQSET